MLTIKWTTVSQLIADGIEDLAFEHWLEAEDDHDQIPLAIDYEHLRALERSGNFKCAAAYHGGELAGYALFTVMASPLRRHSRHAFCDAIFMDPRFRGHGVRLVRWCERELQVLNVVKIMISSRPRVRLGHGRTSGTLGDLLDKMGYTLVETVHGKLLGASRVRRKQKPDRLPTGSAGRR